VSYDRLVRRSNLLITDGEFALCLLIGACERLQLFDGFALRDGDGEFDVAFGVLMAWLQSVSYTDARQSCSNTYVDFRVIRQRAKCLVQRCVHLLRGTLEEATTTLPN